MIQRHKEQ
jgi:hypothetical protein